MTFDSWTSLLGDPFLSITGHYIQSAADNPQRWELRSEQLAFTPIEGNHSGQNISKILLKTVDRFELGEKVCVIIILNTFSLSDVYIIQLGWFTADNATNNDTALQHLSNALELAGVSWDAKQHRVR